MPEYRRPVCHGGTFFLTIVTFERRPLLADPDNVRRLGAAMRAVRDVMPFTTNAVVVLPDHWHWLMTLPTGDADISGRVGRVKVAFTKSLPDRAATRHASRFKHREAEVWQRRFHDHLVRDDCDGEACMDYIHYNPVRHGLCRCPHDWPHGSFGRLVEAGIYDPRWACSCDGRPPVPAPPTPAFLARKP